MKNMIEEVLHPSNLMRAYRQVVVNKGSAGVDGMSTDELYAYLQLHREEIKECILTDVYLPQAIRGVEIPKSNGQNRLLGVPTVIDRFLQQAMGQILCNHYDMHFSEHSYGFRPHRDAHQAVRQSLRYINAGYTYIVDTDLRNFFDEVDHSLLLQILYRKVKCRTSLRLIRKWLRSPIELNGKLFKRRKGMPQGSPLSPILSNILLNELDTELMRLDAKFVRYADDFSVYCTCMEDAEQMQTYLQHYLQERMHLPVNEEKSGIRHPEGFTILGYSFEGLSWDCESIEYQLTVSSKSLKSLKSKLKEATRKTLAYTFDERMTQLKCLQRGWVQYFCLGSIHYTLRRLDQWVRTRLRCCIWHAWKKPQRRCKNLIRMGIKPDIARRWSHTRMGGWATAGSPILTTTINMSRLHRRGYQSMLAVYESIAPHLNEPLYT